MIVHGARGFRGFRFLKGLLSGSIQATIRPAMWVYSTVYGFVGLGL